MAVTSQALPPSDQRPALPRAFGWLRDNLFGSLTNSALTLLTLWLLATLIPRALDWLVFEAVLAPASLRDCIDAEGACWAFIQDKWRLILFGQYPYEQQWRPALALALFAGLVIAACVPALWATPERRRWMAAVLAVGIGLVTLIMAGGLLLPRVEIRFWSGLPLTVMLASIGVVGSFFLAVALALGRRCDMPVIRWTCVAYIELIRGVPLISLLFMANIMMPILLPEGMTIHNIIRAQMAFILFFSAYMAETLRGGLQAVPLGQYAAAKALGMGYWQMMVWIILPQALRIVIPSMVNLFIAAFKDTSLVVIISMADLLGTANSAKADPRWLGLFVEAYFFIAVIYLFVCAAMSWYSRFLERRIGTARQAA